MATTPKTLNPATPVAFGQDLEEVKNLLSRTRQDLSEAINDHAAQLTPTSGSGAPGTTPDRLLLFYIDTAGPTVYVSTGTSSSGDWKALN